MDLCIRRIQAYRNQSSKLFKLAEENSLELFGIVKEALADNIKEVKNVKNT